MTNIAKLGTYRQANVVGTDGRSPIVNPEGKFETWAMSQLYVGGAGENKYVPNPGDLVFDVEGVTRFPIWRVVSISVDMTANLVAWQITPGTTIDDGDYLTGIGGTKQSSTYRCYVDKSVTPYVMAVDVRLSCKGTTAKYAIIFRGNPAAGAPLEPISLFYDNDGNLLGNSIPLELVGVDAGTQRSEYTVPVAATKEDLPDNELVTIIFYSQEGHVVGKNEMLVMNTSFIRSRNISTRYISSVSLNTPFLSPTDPKLIELPMNVPLKGLMLTGRVHYSNGEVVERGIDGVKFRVDGITSYHATIINQKAPINLIYALHPDEIAYGAHVGQQKTMGERYLIRTIPSKGAYYLKLYCYPEWQDAVNGYYLRWFLYNGDRNSSYEVTEHIRYATNSPAFNPKGYGVMQNISAQLDLNKVNGVYANYRFSQVVGIVLRREGTDRDTKWHVFYDPSQDPPYGDNLFVEQEFINYNYYKLRVKGDANTVEEWIDRLYTRSLPLVDPRKEVEPPKPTHFRLRFPDNTTVEFPVGSWNKVFVLNNGWTNNKNLHFEWIRKTPETDLELGISAAPIRPVEGLPDPGY